MKLQLLLFIFLLICSDSWGQKRVAITIDDLPMAGAGRRVDLAKTIALNDSLLTTAQRLGIPIIGFVNEKRILVPSEEEERTDILRMWRDKGAELGNHTFSHPSFYRTSLADFEREVIKGEAVTRMVLEEKKQEIRYFRHPYLNTGSTLEDKTAFEQFLAENGYEIAPVTFDGADYIFNSIYSKAKFQGDTATMAYALEQYLIHTGQLIDYFEELTLSVVGREIPHIYLCHDNELHGDHFALLVQLFRDKGYEFISLSEALTDPVYQTADTFVGKMGISWLHRWNTKNRMELYRQEPEPVARIMELFNQKN